MSTKLLLVDDHTLFRQGLRRILEMEPDLDVVGEASNGEVACACLPELNPDLVIMDLNMPICNGVEATKLMKSQFPWVAILILTIYDDEEYLFEVLKAGAAGYLLKDVEPDRLVDAIRIIVNGGSVVQPEMTNKLIHEFSRLSQGQPLAAGNGAQLLSEREQEVLDLMVQGCSNRDISEKLYISEKTVKNHVSNILRKLEVSDRTQAVVQALKLKLVQLP